MVVGIEVGTKFLLDVEFRYIPLDLETVDARVCPRPAKIQLDAEFLKNKKIVIVSVPGAFTPTCSNSHIPDILKRLKDFKEKGIDLLLVISNNDAFVLNAWKKDLFSYLNISLKDTLKDDFKPKVLFASDPNTSFSKKIGYWKDSSVYGMGIRTSRYAIVIDNGVVTYSEQETQSGVSVSGVDAILAKL
ncbi:peroxiredoxin family protein [Ascoidea rubescens DSM 1968]|uniref:Redoxin n=1 Tax=Ascoidea rubescens DSM 1968 TaxID=1344418 RepID=A0A1D2VBM4_9ASCO|nr:Redoxin [Ascoidea rubescens DSM 1968]ODV58857.1 Redoxin [Ascoidea rubescens DSM 1968]